MKKILYVLIAVLFVGIVTGCEIKFNNESQTEKTFICSLHDDRTSTNGYVLDAEYKGFYKGLYVSRVETVEKITSSNAELLDSFKSSVESTYLANNAKYGGYNYNVTVSGGVLTSTAIIDYEVLDVAGMVKDEPTMKPYTKDNKMTVNGVKAIYESLGATCSD